MAEEGSRGSAGLLGAAESTERGIWRLAIYAFFAMCANDGLLTMMVIFEAHYNAWLAGACDVAGWATGMVCTFLAVDSVLRNGIRNRRSIAIIAAVSVANFCGTWGGVEVSRHALR